MIRPKPRLIETQLKASREDALRKLKDKQELYEEAKEHIALGSTGSPVNNKQPTGLTIVIKKGSAARKIKRTGPFRMLLLVSPPGYGKTTLMEYLANRLGLIFMKINGPAIGHEITSVDPTSASNSAARRRALKKLKLALRWGKQWSCCIWRISSTAARSPAKNLSHWQDGTRKIEGVYKRDSLKTYDMKSKKFCVVMAGNLIQKTGEKFRIPDMLAKPCRYLIIWGDVIGNSA
ncbi:hypothetical protein FQR65_LT20169 [Abscondita terminalis]|nr:hypothetical protein FQR65_LT20169 [Abscondita terminalis]